MLRINFHKHRNGLMVQNVLLLIGVCFTVVAVTNRWVKTPVVLTDSNVISESFMLQDKNAAPPNLHDNHRDTLEISHHEHSIDSLPTSDNEDEVDDTQKTETVKSTNLRSTNLTADSTNVSDQQRVPRPDKCGIWMAPSSLTPFPGFGIFTTIEILKDQMILQAPDAVAVPLRDMRRRKYMPLKEERRRVWMNTFGNVSRIRRETVFGFHFD